MGAIETKGLVDEFQIYLELKSAHVINRIRKLKKQGCKIIFGFSFFTTQLWKRKKLVKDIRQEFGDEIVIIAGGPHPTGDPKGTLNMGVDIVILGEGEESLTELLEKYISGENLHDIKGIAHKLTGYSKTGKRAPINLDDFLPLPLSRGIIGPIEITRGCPYACYFCQTSHIFGVKPRHRSLNKILEIVTWFNEHGYDKLRFITPNAFSYGSKDGKKVNLPKIEELLHEIRKIIGKSGKIYFGSFPSEVRPEHVSKETLDLILKYANNKNIIIGAQSGSQKILDKCHRGHTVEEVYKAAELTIKAGIEANIDFIFSLPGETEEDVELTIKAMKDLSKMGARLHTHSFMPLPMTPFSKAEVKTSGDDIQQVIGRLAAEGKAYGSWQKQQELAIKISEYLKKEKS